MAVVVEARVAFCEYGGRGDARLLVVNATGWGEEGDVRKKKVWNG